jgi:hypothetical protein
MFSETLDLFKDIEDTLSRLMEISEKTEQAILRNTRNTLVDLVKQKGREEYSPERQKSNMLILDVLGETARKFNKSVVDSKIRYTLSLLSMIPEGNLSLFYNDLGLGLDNVIEKWDDSEINPNNTNYRFLPQKVKKRYTWFAVTNK